MKKIFDNFNPDRIREIFLVFLILIVLGVFSIVVPNYINPAFVNRMMSAIVILGVLAVGQSVVFLTRNFDISMGSIVGVSAYLMGFQLYRHPELPIIVAILIAVGAGLIMGAINGGIVAFGRVPSVIATIGTLAIYRTFVIEYGNSLPIMPVSLPDWIVYDFNNIILFQIGEIKFRLVFLIAIVVVIVIQLLLSYHRFGRRLYAVGSNEAAAQTAGFANRKIVFIAYCITGTLGGLGGFLFVSRFANISLQAGIGLEFAAITAVVIGGVSNRGGTGTAIGAFLGAIFIILLENSLYLSAGVSEFVRDAVLGTLILLAVIADYVVIGRLQRVWARKQLERQ